MVGGEEDWQKKGESERVSMGPELSLPMIKSASNSFKGITTIRRPDQERCRGESPTSRI